MFSVAIFAFMWNWDDFQNQLIYLSDVKKFTVSLALRTTIDVSGADNWGAVLAMALCSIIPGIILFFSAQKYFIEGITSTGIKG
jgi:ABC-type glycerol-3-phosphate transport system permease component